MKSKDDTQKVTISTTFSGAHAKLILDLEEEYQVTKPTALRLLLNQYIEGKIISLSSALKERIELVVDNPAIGKQYGFSSTESFVDFAINHTLQTIQDNITDLRDPAVQAKLDQEQQKIAVCLLQSKENSPSGMSEEDIASATSLTKNMVRRILKEFVNNNLVLELENNKYLPVIKKKLPSSLESIRYGSL